MPEGSGNQGSHDSGELQPTQYPKKRKSQRSLKSISFEQFLSDHNVAPIAGIPSKDLKGEGNLAFDGDAAIGYTKLSTRHANGQRDVPTQTEVSTPKQESTVSGPEDDALDEVICSLGEGEWKKQKSGSAGVEGSKASLWDTDERPWGFGKPEKNKSEYTGVEGPKLGSAALLANSEPLSGPKTPQPPIGTRKALSYRSSESAETAIQSKEGSKTEMAHDREHEDRNLRRLYETQRSYDRFLPTMSDSLLSLIHRTEPIHRNSGATAPAGMVEHSALGEPFHEHLPHRVLEEDVRGDNMPRSARVGFIALDAPPPGLVQNAPAYFSADSPMVNHSRYRNIQGDINGMNMPKSTYLGPGDFNMRHSERLFPAPTGVRRYALPSGLIGVLPPGLPLPRQSGTPAVYESSSYFETPPELSNEHRLGISGLAARTADPASGLATERLQESLADPPVAPDRGTTSDSESELTPKATFAPDLATASESESELTPKPSNAVAKFENADILTQTNANEYPSENLRPAPQNLRYGAFQGQQPPQNRNTPLGSGRLQNASKSGMLKMSRSFFR